MFLDPTQPFKTDDSGMAPASLGGLYQQTATPSAAGGPSAFALSHPRLYQISQQPDGGSNLFGNWLWRTTQRLKAQGKFGDMGATPATPAIPQAGGPATPTVPAQPAQPHMGASLGGLFSGYGY